MPKTFCPYVDVFQTCRPNKWICVTSVTVLNEMSSNDFNFLISAKYNTNFPEGQFRPPVLRERKLQ
jgi:hypothetical protein